MHASVLASASAVAPSAPGAAPHLAVCDTSAAAASLLEEKLSVAGTNTQAYLIR
jgi:hypothetical protein